MSKPRHRLTDHEKTLQLLAVLGPPFQEAVRMIGNWLSVPVVGISAAYLGVEGLDRAVDPQEENFGLLKGALIAAIALAAVVPAAPLLMPLAGLAGAGGVAAAGGGALGGLAGLPIGPITWPREYAKLVSPEQLTEILKEKK